MRQVLAPVATVLLLGSAALAWADDTAVQAPSPAGTPDVATPHDENEMICKNVEVTGTLIPRRICFTRQQWEQMHARSRDNLQDVQDRSGARGGYGGSPR